MGHQHALSEQVKAMLAAEYYNRTPKAKELESGDIIVSHDIKLITEKRRVIKVTEQFHCTNDGILTLAALKFNVPQEAYPRAICAINSVAQAQGQEPVCSFEFDQHTGEISVRNFLPCSDHVPTVTSIFTILSNINSEIMNYGDLLIEAIGIDGSPVETVCRWEPFYVQYEAVCGNMTAQNLLIDRVSKDPETEDYSLVKKYADRGDKVALELIQQFQKKQPGFEEVPAHADREDADANCRLGLSYLTGKETNHIDLPRAILWLEYAIKAGSVDALYHLGLCFLSLKEKGLEYLTLAARRGNSIAQLQLGDFYWDGIHVPQDKDQALVWYERAADLSNVDAQIKLGQIYHSDESGYKNLARSALWLEHAAELGNLLAQRQTAINYMTSDGVRESIHSFLFWIEKAANQGDELAMDILRKYCSKSPCFTETNRIVP